MNLYLYLHGGNHYGTTIGVVAATRERADEIATPLFRCFRDHTIKDCDVQVRKLKPDVIIESVSYYDPSTEFTDKSTSEKEK